MEGAGDFSNFWAAVRDERSSGTETFCFTYLPASLLFQRSPTAPSFAARRKIEEKGVPKGSKAALWILAFIRGFGGETCGLFYVCARVQLTRFRPARRRAGGVRFTRLRRKARHHLFSAISLPKALLPPDSIVLHVMQRNCWNLKNNQPDLWSEVGWLRKN